MTLFPFVNFVFFFVLLFFPFSLSLSLSLSHAYARCVCTSLSCGNTRGATASLARSHTQNRKTETEPKIHNRQTCEVAEKRKLKIFLLQMCDVQQNYLLSSGKRSKRRSKEEEEEYLLAGLSVSCFPDVEVPTSFQLSCLCHSISFFVAFFLCFLCSWAVLVFWFCRLFGHGRCVVCVVVVVVVVVFACVRACVFFFDWMCVIVVCFFSSRFVIPNVSP